MPRKISRKIESPEAAKRLDVFCAESLEGVTRSRIKNIISGGGILVNGQPAKAGYKLKIGDILDMVIPDPEETELKAENIALDIAYENHDLLVVDKPAGMVVHPATGNYSGTLVNALLFHIKDLSGIGGELKPGIVHRLDKNTSGLLIIAKNDNAHVQLSQQIQERTAKRLYKAIVIGDLPQDLGTFSFPVGRSPSDRKKMAVTYGHSKEAITSYEVLERYGKYTLARLQLFTGRTHQIRVHLSHCGYPVLGDPEYGGRTRPHESLSKDELDLWRKLLKLMPRQALHAFHLEFNHPVSGKQIVVDSPLPDDFTAALLAIRTHYRK
ncbi:MAG: RNA pseudouridine synthase [candidate division Zixibacteria bacterium CG_4_9_14_3_um_filter_46_8]|nr:MAG: RNA pseudouridine synthase [candidate division Zixibacteria bacterium CG_4_9_14_3_um_filter_46_8]